VPCTTPLNMTITLDDRPEIPLHPLDLTAEPLQDNQAEFCTGLIQTADSQLSNPSNDLGDIILGVPFLRNVYTVMAYIAPDANGSFTPVNGSNQTITPMLGLLSLTDPTIALEEFHTVRDLKQPISGGNSSGGSAGDSPNNSTINVGGKKAVCRDRSFDWDTIFPRLVLRTLRRSLVFVSTYISQGNVISSSWR